MDRKTALLIVDHGSTRDEANAMLAKVAAVVQSLSPGLSVHFAHMEIAEPTMAQAFDQCVKDGATEIVVHPYMLSPGKHSVRDIPRMSAECAAKYPGLSVRVTEPLGVDKKIGEVILERAGLM